MKMGANPKGVIKFSASGLTGLSPEYEDDVARAMRLILIS